MEPNQFGALLHLILESQQTRNTKASHKRLLKACKTLNLNDEQTRQLESMFEYRDGLNGELYLK